MGRVEKSWVALIEKSETTEVAAVCWVLLEFDYCFVPKFFSQFKNHTAFRLWKSKNDPKIKRGIALSEYNAGIRQASKQNSKIMVSQVQNNKKKVNVKT